MNIDSSTPFPWSIFRTIELEDGTVVERLKIVAEDKHYAVGGDWYVDLTGRNLDDDQRDEAMDMGSDILSEVAFELSEGRSVPVHG